MYADPSGHNKVSPAEKTGATSAETGGIPTPQTGGQEKLLLVPVDNSNTSLVVYDPDFADAQKAIMQSDRMPVQAGGGSWRLALPGPGETSISSRRAVAEQKLADAARGSHGSGRIDFIGTDYGVSIHTDQNAMENSLVRAGANGTGEYVYANGSRITGAISRRDRAAIGHTHGQH